MKTIPTATRVAGLLLLSLAALSLSSCGDETAPQGATISAPSDATYTYPKNTGLAYNSGTASPLEFQVLDANGDPLPGVRIRFFAGGQVFALVDRAGTLLNGTDPTLFETTTNDQGISTKDVYPVWQVPSCDAAADVTLTGTVSASVGVTSVLWTVTYTSPKC